MIYFDFVTSSKQAKKGFIEACSLQMQIDPSIVEKDLWVVFTLSALFDRIHFYNDKTLNAMIFKGGTSLSKAYNIIERFSEDIDITVDRAILGWTASDEEFSQGSGNERKKALEELNKRGREFIEKHVQGYLQTRLSGFAQEEVTVRFSEEDFLALEVFYPSCLHTSYSAYIPQRIYVEFGFRGGSFPSKWINVRPYVHEKIKQLNDLCVPVNVLSPVRTFFEKITLLHAEEHRLPASSTKPRMFRHYYDIHQLVERGYLAKAEELCSQCLSLCEKHNFTDYADLAAIHMALCVAHREQGHYKKAEEHIHKSLDIFKHHLSHQYLDHAHAIRLLGHVCSDQGLYLQARDLYQKSLDLFVQHQQQDHPKALWLYVKLGTLCRRLGEIDQAHAYLDQAEQSEAFATSYVVQGLTYHERAHLSIQQGDYDKALALARQSHGVYTQLFGANHVKARRALNLVGYALMFRGDFDEAEQCMKLALQTFTQYYLPLRCQALDYLSELCRRRLSQAKPEQEDTLRQQALSYADQALSVAEEYFPPDSKHVAHLKKQRDRIVATHAGDDQKSKDMTKRCQ